MEALRLSPERQSEYHQGLLDNMSVLVCDHIDTDVVKYVKVKDLREALSTESLWLQLFNLIDLEEFVVNSIQDRGIVVIDEIDKICTPTINLGVAQSYFFELYIGGYNNINSRE